MSKQLSSRGMRWVIWLSRWSGFNWLSYRLNHGSKRILAYHNVIPDAHYRNDLHEGVSHSESVFRAQIGHLARHFKLGLDLADPRQLTLSFDDGYRNQHAVAHPILMQFGIQAYFFCTLDLVRDSRPLLIDEIMCWLGHARPGEYVIALPGVAEPMVLALRDETDCSRCWGLLYPLLLADYPTVAPALRAELDRCQPFGEIWSRLDASYVALRFTPILPHALEAMKAYGHLIGAHGKTHAPIGRLAPRLRDEELRACAAAMGTTYNTAVFCFPYGGLAEVADEVEEHGFTQAFSNVNLPLPKPQSYHDLMIPRMALGNTADPSEIDFVLSGAKHFLKHGRLLPSW